MKRWQRRALGILTLGGSAVGVSLALSIMFTRQRPIEWALYLVFILLYAWGAWCGVKLLEQQPGAERSLFRFWLIQIPTFQTPLIGYFMSCGFHVTVSMQFDPILFGTNFLLGSMFQYSLLQSHLPWMMGINLFAAAIAWWLLRQSRLAKQASGAEASPPP